MLMPTLAAASVVTIQVAATVGYVDDRFNVLGGRVSPGDTVTGTYSYNTTATDQNASSNVGDYYFTDAPYGVSLSVNGLVFQTNPASVAFLLEVVNDYYARDNYVFHSYDNLFAVSAPGPNPRSIISWQLDDPTQSALSSDALPATPPDLSRWQSFFGLEIMSNGNGEDFAIRSTVTSVALVPEPSATALFILGVSALLLWRGRRLLLAVRGFGNQPASAHLPRA